MNNLLSLKFKQLEVVSSGYASFSVLPANLYTNYVGANKLINYSLYGMLVTVHKLLKLE